MANDKYYKILERLINKTENGELEWKEGVYPETFQVAFSNYSLTVGQRSGEDDTLDYVISIRDASGNVIDTFSDVDLGSGYFKTMGELYENARRQALGVDKALDEILNDLDGTF
jgi:hypothetical protein